MFDCSSEFKIKVFIIWQSGKQTFGPLGFVHTPDLDLAISPSDAISIEILPSFQIAIAGDSNNM